MLNQKFRHMIKTQSETKILAKHWRISNWLPELGEPDWRSLDEVKQRMAVMHAMIYLAFNVAPDVISNWLDKYGLSDSLTKTEKELLSKSPNTLTKEEVFHLLRYVESLWAFLWATKMADDLSPDKLCAENMAQMLPNVYEDEDNGKIESLTELRGIGQCYEQLDFYQRVHWFCVDEVQSGKKLVPPLDVNTVESRYKALMWLYDKKQDWDKVQLV